MQGEWYYLLSCCWAVGSWLLWRRGGSCQETQGRLCSDLLGIFPIFPHGRKSDVKRDCWKKWTRWGWPHLPHLPSNFGEGLGSNTKPFSFSSSLFPSPSLDISTMMALINTLIENTALWQRNRDFFFITIYSETCALASTYSLFLWNPEDKWVCLILSTV